MCRLTRLQPWCPWRKTSKTRTDTDSARDTPLLASPSSSPSPSPQERCQTKRAGATESRQVSDTTSRDQRRCRGSGSTQTHSAPPSPSSTLPRRHLLLLLSPLFLFLLPHLLQKTKMPAATYPAMAAPTCATGSFKTAGYDPEPSPVPVWGFVRLVRASHHGL